MSKRCQEWPVKKDIQQSKGMGCVGKKRRVQKMLENQKNEAHEKNIKIRNQE